MSCHFQPSLCHCSWDLLNIYIKICFCQPRHIFQMRQESWTEVSGAVMPGLLNADQYLWCHRKDDCEITKQLAQTCSIKQDEYLTSKFLKHSYAFKNLFIKHNAAIQLGRLLIYTNKGKQRWEGKWLIQFSFWFTKLFFFDCCCSLCWFTSHLSDP